MYDASKLKTQEDCRTVMQRARDRKLPDVYNAAFKRFCELAGAANDDPSDPLVRDFYETLAAYEQLLTEKNARNTPATRTRQKVNNKGVYQSLIEWTRGKKETEGFKLLIEKGLPEYTGEYSSFATPSISGGRRIEGTRPACCKRNSVSSSSIARAPTFGDCSETRRQEWLITVTCYLAALPRACMIFLMAKLT